MCGLQSLARTVPLAALGFVPTVVGPIQKYDATELVKAAAGSDPHILIDQVWVGVPYGDSCSPPQHPPPRVAIGVGDLLR